ncbi:hypothetical protein B7P43_G17395 [Cryptotermes secundus]|uniref:Uncharacterized protein n=1 Tax=Cryptotermes secundus TaxID=105785 RepID=A0A2J7R4C3_9NEOP|nr:hypothetical protein B7P43_G17395 [Cryptotermes secundus]
MENEKLVEQFRLENQKLSQEFSRKLQAETSKVSCQVRQLQGDTERELQVVQEKLQGISSEFETRLEQQSRSNQELTGELSGKVLEVRTEVIHLANDIEILKDDLVKRAEDLEKRQGESTAQLNKAAEAEKLGIERKFELLNSAIDKLKDKLAGVTPMTCGTEVTQIREVTNAVHGSPTPPPTANMARIENVQCSCNSNSCSVCVNGVAVCESTIEPVRHHSANSYLSCAAFPLPQFDKSSEVNPIFHLNQLDEFMRLRSVPKTLQLSLAFKSIVGAVGKQWVATVARNLSDYEQFKVAFSGNYWSKSKQSLVRCSLYQDRCNPRSGLSLSSHFLKYATMASYLEPRPSDTEVTEAVTHHFPVMVQRAMIGSHLSTVGEALDLLKRVEMMEGDGSYQGSNPVTHQPDQTSRGNPPSREGYERSRPNQYYARRVQYDRRNEYCRYDNRRGHLTRGGFGSSARDMEPVNSRPAAGNSLNPHAPTFASTDGRRAGDLGN